MPHRTFFWFILPSALAMLLFIAFPLVSVIVQSLHVEHEQILVTSENCGPFGCKQSTSVDVEASAKLKEAAPLGRFNGFGTYVDRGHLATAEISAAWSGADSWGAFFSRVMNLPFYKALAFTLAYTAVVTPLVILFGLAVALGV
ncbi:MAG: sugar ABC transporter permease, partial [Sulfitobacter sp.]